MASDESLPTIKILLIGPSGAGKSALLIRYTDDLFDPDSSTATIGVDFKTKKLSVHGHPLHLHLLDTAGQERFRTLSASYYRLAAGALLVYDLSARDSFLAMPRWFDEVREHAPPGCVTYLVGAKLDKAERAGGRAVTREEGERLAEKMGCVGFAEVSAKVGGRETVRRPFVEIVEGIAADEELMKRATQGWGRGGLKVGEGDAGGWLGGCGC